MRWLSCYCFRIVYNLLLVSALERAYAHNSRRGENSANHDNQFDAALFWPPRRNRIKNCKKIVSLAGGALNETNPTTTLWQPQLPAGVVRYQTTKILWYIPLAICVFSFWSFKWTSLWFHIIVQWASSNTWIPITDEEVNLQTNVVTQVVNGPVITSISLLFASLVSLTISNLHMRQVDTHKSLVVEVHNVRRLQSLLESPAARVSFDEERLREALLLLKQHKDVLFSVRYTTHAERKNDAHAYIESVLPALLLWSNEQELWHQRSLRTGRTQEPPPLAHFQYSPHTAHMLVSQVQLLVHRLMHERGKRWMALQTAPFPTVHYLTLALLALSIVISFLVATAQAEFIFLRGMPVRVLWSVLITSFSALGVVCFDLARPFGGAYHIL